MRKLIRSILTWLFLSVVLVIAIMVIGQWFVEVAKDKGLYADAGDRWDFAVGTVLPILTSGWLLFPLVALGGTVAGMWLDLWARHLDDRRSPDDIAFYSGLASTHRGFRSVEEHLKQGGVPATIPQLQELVARFESQQIGLERRGIDAPWLNYSSDPVGFFYRSTTYLNRIVPMVQDGHLTEAREAARQTVGKLRIEHPGPNGRNAG